MASLSAAAAAAAAALASPPADSAAPESAVDAMKKVQQQVLADFERLRAAHEELQAAHERALRELEDQRRQTALAQEGKAALEQECQNLYGEYEEHMKQQAAEFADLQAQTVPLRELDGVRVEVAREMDEKHSAHVGTLRAEIDKYKALYTKERQQHELNRTKAEQVHQARQRRQEDVERKLRGEVERLAAKARELQELVDDRSFDEQIASLEAENTQLLARVKSLHEEMEAARRGKQQAAADRDVERSACVREVTHQKGRVAELTKEKQALASQNAQLKKDLDARQATIADLQAQLIASQQECHNLGAQLTTSARQTHSVREQLEARARQLTAELAHKAQQHETVVEQLRERVLALDKECDRTRQLVEFERREKRTDLQRAKDEEAKRLWELEHEKKALRERLVAKEDSARELAEAHEAELDSLKLELESARQTGRALTQDREALVAKLHSLEETVATLKGDFERQHREHAELQSEYQAVQKAQRDLLQKNKELAGDRERLAAQLATLREEAEHLTHELDEQRGEHAATLITATHADGDKSKTAAGLRRDKARYKKMAIALRERLQKSEQHKKELMSHLETKTFELRSVQQQIRDVERQRDELKLRASMGAAAAGFVPPPVAHGDSDTQREIQALMARLESVSASQ